MLPSDIIKQLYQNKQIQDYSDIVASVISFNDKDGNLKIKFSGNKNNKQIEEILTFTGYKHPLYEKELKDINLIPVKMSKIMKLYLKNSFNKFFLFRINVDSKDYILTIEIEKIDNKVNVQTYILYSYKNENENNQIGKMPITIILDSENSNYLYLIHKLMEEIK